MSVVSSFPSTTVLMILSPLTFARCPANSVSAKAAKYSEDTIYVFDWGNWVTSMAQAMKDTEYILVQSSSDEVEMRNSGYNGNNPKLKLKGTGLSLASCGGDITWYLALLLVENMRKGVPRESIYNDPVVDCPCVGKGCVPSPPSKNSTGLLGCKNTPCGCIDPKCTCSPGGFQGYYWGLPTSARIVYDVPGYTGVQINLAYSIDAGQQCGFDGGKTFSGLLDIGNDILGAGGISSETYDSLSAAGSRVLNATSSTTEDMFEKEIPNISEYNTGVISSSFIMPSGCKRDPYAGPLQS
ncbi:hypothetical protein HDU76_013268 [Blyttiomyces sp. JEL0837]|nr:hypothetical protein HDU76_013268 [Blyttiomyces sp. JEL0837]